MLNTVYAGAAVLVTLFGLFAFARNERVSGRLSPEAARKLVHVGMGCVCLTFPWLFTVAQVLLLAAIATAMLLATRAVPNLRATFGCVLQDVDRNSYGEFAFVAGVLSAFALADGNLFLYGIPVAILTFADTCAAIAGARLGTVRILHGSKTLEGSAAFLAVSVACAAVPLAIVNAPHAMLVATVTGIALMAIEAVSRSGFDNLAIPLLGGLLLRSFGATVGA
jgi:phytol kinase